MSSQSQSQDVNISQFFPNGQRTQPSRKARLEEAQERYNAALIAKNNNEDEDKGVHDVLIALGTNNKIKSINQNKAI